MNSEQSNTVNTIEAFAKILKAYYAAEARFLKEPSEATFGAFMDTMEHFYALRDQVIAVARLRRSLVFTEASEKVEEILSGGQLELEKSLDLRDAEKSQK